ncbi:hypothetical protein [Streptomyces albireticuli]|uniref:hypothetical protein n=1 Tax=Streptomyces albireticuli TaxID=1940 RepID=UPI0011814170|nr:hypothetical protein [Streptomyces albireticuli]MCD9141467.1 hypothetical protein [Streptomyces albireticuli]MCD9164282.1 hypothetical protein [Streptomyces albireticuli]MCD9196399.1 hypothetical protein [Streptomyces albireticuli]
MLRTTEAIGANPRAARSTLARQQQAEQLLREKHRREDQALAERRLYHSHKRREAEQLAEAHRRAPGPHPR